MVVDDLDMIKMVADLDVNRKGYDRIIDALKSIQTPTSPQLSAHFSCLPLKIFSSLDQSPKHKGKKALTGMSLPPCGCAGCREKSMVGGPACEFCSKTHCVKHLVPESHGCRDAAKNAARMFATRDAAEVLQAKKAHDTQDLREKLAKKREELAQQRAKKAPAKK